MFASGLFEGIKTGELFTKGESYSSTGSPIFSLAGEIRYTPIRLESMLERTSIRADKSGSKSRAEELTFKGRILVEPTETSKKMSNGSILKVLDDEYRIMDINPLFSAMDGDLHHYMVDLGL